MTPFVKESFMQLELPTYRHIATSQFQLFRDTAMTHFINLSNKLVKIGLRVLTRPLPDQLPTIYGTLGEKYNERVLPSIIHETLKAVVAQYNASQLVTQREVVDNAFSSIKR
ncbi:hypothetical protein Sjap_025820 [Stephania japonica]|uniref:Prohibitin n=1 Tax=Stephania japonica TaxID=461633 RepID=A0AAP0HFZ1_9MAGN